MERQGQPHEPAALPPGGRVTINEIARRHNRSPHTVRYHRAHSNGFPRPLGVRREPGQAGRPSLEYAAEAAEGFYQRPAARGDAWAADERVTGPTAAQRLGVAWNTFRCLPTAYPMRSLNPFPRRGEDGRYRWGDIAVWDASRPGSGRRRAADS